MGIECSAVRRVATMCLAAIAALGTVPAEAQRSQGEGFARMELQSAGGRHAYARVRFPDGTGAERFVLRPGDCPASTGDCRADRERVEFFDSRSRIRSGDEVWYAWSLLVPADFPRPARGGPPYTLGQVHQYGTSGPEVLFIYQADGYLLKMTDPTRPDDDPMRPLPDFRLVDLATPGQMAGRWTRVMMQAKWSRGGDGLIRVWINGRPAWRYDGPTTNANEPLYFKYGIYRAFVSRCGGPCPEATVYYRDVRQGRSREEVE